MALTTEQRALRAGRIGSSDAPHLMAGRWRELWLEKTGRTAPPDLDLVPAVQIGIATEHLHARFYEHRTGIPCLPAGERSFVHPEHDFLVAHPDFLTWAEAPADPLNDPPDTVLEAKFHAGLKSDEELAERYYWQLQHQMLVGGFRRSVLSVLRPGAYAHLQIDRNEADIAVLLETARAFWWHVENDIEPENPFAVDPPAFDRLKVLNMARHNEFAALSGTLIETRAAFLSFRSAETALKALMPEGARVAYLPPAREEGGENGGLTRAGVVLTRARDGKLSLRFGDLPKRHRERAEEWGPEIQAAEDS